MATRPTKPKSTAQKLIEAGQAEMKKNATVRPPKPTGDRAADKKSAEQFVAATRKQTADRAAAAKAATAKQQQLDYTRANPLQGTRPATVAARAQVAQSRAPMVYQTPGQIANYKKAQAAEAAARAVAQPRPAPIAAPPASPIPNEMPKLVDPRRLPFPGYQPTSSTPTSADFIQTAYENNQRLRQAQPGTMLPPDLASTLPTNPATGLPVGVEIRGGPAITLPGQPNPNPNPQELMNQYASVISGAPANAYTPNFNPQQQQQIQAQTDFLTQTLPPSLATLQPGAATQASMTPQDLYSQYANNIFGAPGTTNLATLQPGTMTASTPAIQNTIAPGYQTATPGATGIYALPAAAGRLDQSGQGGIYGQPGQPGTYLSGTTQYPLDVGPLGGSSGQIPSNMMALSSGNQPYSINQTYGQTQGPNSGTQTAPGIDPNFNTNSSQPTGQLPQNAPNFGQQQQTTQQANPIKIQVENPTPKATMGSGSGKFGGSGSPMGTINTSAL